ncbi:MAG: hypothetical protein ACOCXQ_04440 [Patescibacteria group bacterium]
MSHWSVEIKRWNWSVVMGLIFLALIVGSLIAFTSIWQNRQMDEHQSGTTITVDQKANIMFSRVSDDDDYYSLHYEGMAGSSYTLANECLLENTARSEEQVLSCNGELLAIVKELNAEAISVTSVNTGRAQTSWKVHVVPSGQ